MGRTDKGGNLRRQESRKRIVTEEMTQAGADARRFKRASAATVLNDGRRGAKRWNKQERTLVIAQNRPLGTLISSPAVSLARYIRDAMAKGPPAPLTIYDAQGRPVERVEFDANRKPLKRTTLDAEGREVGTDLVDQTRRQKIGGRHRGFRWARSRWG